MYLGGAPVKPYPFNARESDRNVEYKPGANLARHRSILFVSAKGAKFHVMLRKLLAHLLFLPNVMIPLGMPGIETFPHATLFSLNRRTTVTVGYALILIILGGSAVYGLFTIGQPFSIIRDYVSIINASLIFYRIIHTDREDYDLIVKALITIFLLNIGISILQRTSLLPNFM